LKILALFINARRAIKNKTGHWGMGKIAENVAGGLY